MIEDKIQFREIQGRFCRMLQMNRRKHRPPNGFEQITLDKYQKSLFNQMNDIVQLSSRTRDIIRNISTNLTNA